MAAQAFQASDAAYAKQCLAAAQRCWSAAKREGNTGDLAWWVMAALEMRAAAGRDVYAVEAAQLGGQLLALQTAEFVYGQKSFAASGAPVSATRIPTATRYTPRCPRWRFWSWRARCLST